MFSTKVEMSKSTENFVNKKWGPFGYVRFGTEAIKRMVTEPQFKNYPLEFKGLRLFGLYVGIFDARHIRHRKGKK